MTTGSARAADTAGTAEDTTRGAGRRRRLAGVLAWTAVTPFALWTLLRLLPADVHLRWVQLIAFTPYVALASAVAPLVALAARRRVALAAGLAVTATLATCVAPRVLPESGPEAGGPALRVLSANLLMGSVPGDALAELVRKVHPDVLALQEVTPAAVKSLREAGLPALLPYAMERAMKGVGGSALYARYPLEADKAIEFGGFRQIAATMAVPGAGTIRVMSVHPCAPRYQARLGCWADGLAALPLPGGDVRILAGDFNATLDHARIRRLLGGGYRDAADAAGEGLAGTWPYRPWRFDGLAVPPVTIDHIMADPRVAVRSYEVHPLPLTDHRAISAELTLPRG
ncbi:endonuclease/exonuclease/phosphatase family protein [Microbispora sp. NPDC049125]|uniref:endonuclease/exonuclease/phosphatase family protein n=1 Tax=Microbispora sp. NPDC049125 TaxID=3154929 RepID=UPI003465F849